VAVTKAERSASRTRTASERAWDLVRELIGGGEMAERMRGLCDTYRLAPGPIKALQHLHRGGYPSMRDVARSLGCDPSYVTGLVDDLARRGLVERQSDPHDRRVKTVVLTPRGTTVAKDIEETFGALPASFGVLTAAEAEHLGRLLAKVTESARATKD
jgi:MarR family transcriptional regulator, organic hydroperoxide resistance regulator